MDLTRIQGTVFQPELDKSGHAAGAVYDHIEVVIIGLADGQGLQKTVLSDALLKGFQVTKRSAGGGWSARPAYPSVHR